MTALLGLVAALVALSLALPHHAALNRARPEQAIMVWGASLVLRATLVLGAAIFLFRCVPASDLVRSAVHWSWHTALPGLSGHLGLHGDAVRSAAALLPLVLLALSLATVGYGLVRASRAVATFVRRGAVGPGPDGSLIVGEPGVFVAAAGVARPRIIISPLALAVLDEPELQASLQHERGHMARRHRYVLIAVELLRAVARVVPGSGRVVREIQFHLERDADRWAVARGGDPLALASAICKAAELRPSVRPPALTTLSGASVTARVVELMEGRVDDGGRSVTVLAAWLSALALTAVVALATAVVSPTLVAAAYCSV